MPSTWFLTRTGNGRQSGLECVDCGRPVVYIQARTPYEALIRARQVNHRLCGRCARKTEEVGADLDGLRRKARFLKY